MAIDYSHIPVSPYTITLNPTSQDQNSSLTQKARPSRSQISTHYLESLNCLHNRANPTNYHSVKAALASPSWAESEQPLVIVGPLACSVQPGNKLDRRPLNSLACSALSSRTVLLLSTSNSYINTSQSVASSPLLSDVNTTSPLNTAIMRYSTLLMIAASVFVVAQDAAEPSITDAAEPSNTLTGLYKEASRASAMEESQRSAASVDRTAERQNTGLHAEASRASAMEESQRSAASVAKTAERQNTGLNAEASRASAMEESQRSAASVAKTADRQNTGLHAEASRASAMEESQRSAASVAKTADRQNTGLHAEASRASAMEESQRSAAAVAKTAEPQNTGLRAEASRASAMEESQRAAAQSDKENIARETGFPALVGAAGLALAALL
jgi:hypothetical protein